MNHLTRNDYASALRVLARIEAQAGDVDSFARAAVLALNEYMASELTTLSVCDLCTGQRQVTGLGAVSSRRRLGFNERDYARLELLRPHLAFLYRHACQSAAAPAGGAPPPPEPGPPGLTRREGEVMHWLACGKTDAEIAALLSISPRTVQKHLEHVYVKLGVETRTAAVMRALAVSGIGCPGRAPRSTLQATRG